MKLIDVVVLTDERWINPVATDTYTQNVLQEDRFVVNALKKQSLRVERKAWSDPDFDWQTTKSVLFRTTWDYFDRFPEFLTWLNRASKLTRLFNSENLIRWNLDKHYLLDINKKGVRITPTRFIEKGEQRLLIDIINNTGWYDSVLKPCVSGAARHTYRLNPENCNQYQNIFQSLIKEESMMLQPFQYNIVTEGEVSLMVMNGTYSHAILKKAKPGDFRVQDDFGGSVHLYQPDANAIAFAEKAVDSCIEKPIYARVDMFKDNEGKWAVSELELIEPELWFRYCPEAANKLAVALVDVL
jgi:hypothetical protein